MKEKSFSALQSRFNHVFKENLFSKTNTRLVYSKCKLIVYVFPNLKLSQLIWKIVMVLSSLNYCWNRSLKEFILIMSEDSLKEEICRA